MLHLDLDHNLYIGMAIKPTENRERDMTSTQLEAFRNLAEQMIGTADWEWIGPHMSQRMFGITRERAEAYAQRHGGIARQMEGGLR